MISLFPRKQDKCYIVSSRTSEKLSRGTLRWPEEKTGKFLLDSACCTEVREGTCLVDELCKPGWGCLSITPQSSFSM